MGLFRRPTMYAGLDVGASALKLLQLSRDNNQYCVETYATLNLPEDVIVEKEIKEIEVFTERVQQLLEQSRHKANALALALPSSFVITKIVSIDQEVKPSEMESHIELEANRFVPYPIDEVSLDFAYIGPSEKRDDYDDYLVVASRSEQVESRVDAVQDGGLPVKIVDVESFALERAAQLCVAQLPEGGQGKNIAIVNVGSSSMSLAVLSDMSVVYTRDEVFGGRQLTDEVMARFELTHEQAEFAKMQNKLPEPYHIEILDPFKETLAVQVSHSLQFYESSDDSEEAEIHHILLAGGVSIIDGIAELITQRVGIPCTVANPFSEMKVAKSVNRDTLMHDAPSLMIACGLAMRNFDS